MSISLGPGGFMNFVTTARGAQKTVRLISFDGRTDTGDIAHPQFRAGENALAVINTQTGLAATGSFDTTVKTGAITQTDTGSGTGPYIAITMHPA